MSEDAGTSARLLTTTELRTGIEAATSAWPSSSPVPWRILATPRGIEMHADIALHPSGDVPATRQLYIDCGAALLKFRVAVGSIGWSAAVQLLPDPSRPRVLAFLRAHDRIPAGYADRDLAAQLWFGRPDRAAIDAPVAESVRNALRQAARSEQGWLAVISLPALPLFERLAAEAARPATGPLGAADDPSLAVGATRGGRHFASPALVAVLGTLGDRPLAHLQAGQSMQRVLGTATDFGLAPMGDSEFMHGSVARREIRGLIGGALWPQVILRLGYPSPLLPVR